MAVPTVTSLTPALGLPAGRGRVEVIGTGFRLPPVPPPGGSDPPLTGPLPKPGDQFSVADWLRTVSVKINGLEADDVIPVSATRLWVITPEYRGDPTVLPAIVDVVVTNLDNSGVPIGGETVTVAGGWTYRRQDLVVDSDIAWVQRNVLDRFQRNIIANVMLNTGLDFADAAVSSLLLALADLPAIMLFGPAVLEDDEGEERNERDFPTAGGDDVFVNAAPLSVSLVWRMLVLSDDKLEALNLANLVGLDLRKRPFLVMETAQGSGTNVEFDLFLDEPLTASDDFGEEVHGHETTLRLRGLLLDETYGVEQGGVPIEDVIAPLSDDTDDVPTLQVQQGVT